MAYRVIVTDAEYESLDRERAILEEIGAEIVLSPSVDESVLTELCQDADAIAVQNGPLPASIIRALTRCRVIVSYGIGYDSIDVQAASDKKIPVANIPDFCVGEVADHVIMLLLAVSRKLIQAHKLLMSGDTQWGYRPCAPVWRLYGKTLGLVGLGKIGRAVAKRAQAFGMRVIAYDPYITPSLFTKLGIETATLESLLRGSDFVSLHCFLAEETVGMIGEKELGLMKPTAYLINAARAAIVDQGALLRTLEEGWIAGASLDVFMGERPDEVTLQTLRRLDNVAITPHMAWYSEEALAELQKKVGWSLRIALEGGRPPSVVNPEVYGNK